MWTLRVLTTTKAEKECNINEGVGSSQNLQKYLVKTLKHMMQWKYAQKLTTKARKG
jgi:hypothetical protein